MNILIFRTDLRTRKRVRAVSPLLNGNPCIQHWTVDREDIDNVLRVVTRGALTEEEVIRQVRRKGFSCDVLTD